jgi:multicomponent K+:H+ antiporter subunit D
VGALFAIMSKVGLYTLLRLWTLLFSADAGASAFFGGNWLIAGGMLTLVFGAVGMVASQKLGNLAGYGVVVSSGTLLAAFGFGQSALTAGALYYMLSSTLAACALFLVVDLIERWRNDGATFAPHEQGDHAPFLSPDLKPLVGINLDEEQQVLIGRAIPSAIAFLGLAFMGCAVLIAGLPPLSGFIGKMAMLSALLNPLGLGHGITDVAGVPGISNTPGAPQWTLLALVIGSGLLSLIAMSRAGIRHFWAAQGRGVPTLRIAEGVPIGALLLGCVLLTVFGGRALRYTQDTADALRQPQAYLQAVMQARPVPNPQKPGATP